MVKSLIGRFGMALPLGAACSQQGMAISYAFSQSTDPTRRLEIRPVRLINPPNRLTL
jgi:hypothetical protein